MNRILRWWGDNLFAMLGASITGLLLAWLLPGFFWSGAALVAGIIGHQFDKWRVEQRGEEWREKSRQFQERQAKNRSDSEE